MSKELIIKKCPKCGSLIKVIEDCHCPNGTISCCDTPMETIIPNTTEASVEKHIPTYQKVDDQLQITVNHVMEKDHYIKFILIQTKNEVRELHFTPNDFPTMTIPYQPGMTIYSYCNKHGLWKEEVK